MQKRDGYTVRTEGKYQLITVQGKDLYIQHAKGINYVYAPEGRSIPAFYFAKNPDSWELSWNDGSGDIKILESYPSLSAAVLGMKEIEDKWFEDHEGEPPIIEPKRKRRPVVVQATTEDPNKVVEELVKLEKEYEKNDDPRAADLKRAIDLLES